MIKFYKCLNVHCPNYVKEFSIVDYSDMKGSVPRCPRCCSSNLQFIRDNGEGRRKGKHREPPKVKDSEVWGDFSL